jgi:hypothetical protein
MPAPARPSVRPRPGGGFNQGLGQFGEAFDESVAGQAMQQKALGQQQVSPSGAAAAAQAARTQVPQQQPREVGSFKDELIDRPLKDMWHEITQFFALNTWLGIDPNTKDPKEQQKMVATHRRYQQLTKEQQAVARQKYQEEMKKKQWEEQEKQRKKQLEEQQKAQDLPMPSSPNKGPVGPGGSKKQKAAAKLQHDRQTLGSPQGSN